MERVIWGYSSVVEHSTADREVHGSTPCAPWTDFWLYQSFYSSHNFRGNQASHIKLHENCDFEGKASASRPLCSSVLTLLQKWTIDWWPTTAFTWRRHVDLNRSRWWLDNDPLNTSFFLFLLNQHVVPSKHSHSNAILFWLQLTLRISYVRCDLADILFSLDKNDGLTCFLDDEYLPVKNGNADFFLFFYGPTTATAMKECSAMNCSFTIKFGHSRRLTWGAQATIMNYYSFNLVRLPSL